MWNAQSHQIWQKSRPVAFNLASDIRRIRYDVDIILRKDQFDRRGRGMQGRHLVTLPYRKARNQIETGYYSPKVLTSSGPALVATFASPWTMMRICSTISGLASIVDLANFHCVGDGGQHPAHGLPLRKTLRRRLHRPAAVAISPARSSRNRSGFSTNGEWPQSGNSARVTRPPHCS